MWLLETAGVVLHRVTGYVNLQGTHEDLGVQLPAPHRFCDPSYLWSFMSAALPFSSSGFLLKPCLECQGLSPGMTLEMCIFQKKTIVTLAKMLYESSGSAAEMEDKICLAALNSAGKKQRT